MFRLLKQHHSEFQFSNHRQAFHTNISLRQKREGESALKSAMVALVTEARITSASDGMSMQPVSLGFQQPSRH